MVNKKQSTRQVERLKKSIIFLCILAFFIVPIANILSAHPALASKDQSRFKNLSDEQKYTFFRYASAMAQCFSNTATGTGDSSDYKLDLKTHRNVDGKLAQNIVFNANRASNYVYVGTYTGLAGYDGGAIGCADENFQKKAFENFGVSANELLCYMGYKKYGHENASAEECTNLGSNNDFINESLGFKGRKSEFLAALFQLTGFSTEAENEPYIKYMKFSDWAKGCVDGEAVSTPSNNTWTVSTVSNGKVVSLYKPKGKLDYEWDSSGIHYKGRPEFQCSSIMNELAVAANRYAPLSLKSAAEKTCKDQGYTGKELEACIDGANHRDDPSYCQNTYARDLIQSCQKGQSVTATDPTASNEENKKDCGDVLDSGLLGYFICPAINVAISFADGAWSMFEFLLINNPLESDSSYYSAWTKVRDLANAILVVIFIGIVISQVSNIGISNYGIKKMLPKLIIMAVAINISYYLMQIVVDIANITGKSIDGLFGSLSSYDGLSSASGWSVLLDTILAAITVGSGVGIALAAGVILGGPAVILFLGAMLIPAIIGIIAGLLALQIRAMLIPILAIFSPVALVAWVLPNTQKLFDRWRGMFTGLVFLYPLAALYYGGLKFAASTMLIGGEANSIQRLMSLAALFVGTFMVAVIAIKSNAIMGKVAGGIGGFVNKLGVSRFGGFLSNTATNMMATKRAEFVNKGPGRNLLGRNPFTRGAHKVMRHFSDSKKIRQIDQANYEAHTDRDFKESLASGKYDKRMRSLELPGSAARIQEMAHSLTATEIKNAQISFGNASIQELKSALSDAIKSGDSVKARAAQNILLSSRGPAGIDAHNQAIGETEQHMSKDMSTVLRSNIQESNSGVFDKDSSLLKWASGAKSTIQGARDAAAVESTTLDKFTSMTKSAQLDKISGGGISSSQAASAIDPSGTTFAKLDPEVVEALTKVAGNSGSGGNSNAASSSGDRIVTPSADDIRKYGK